MHQLKLRPTLNDLCQISSSSVHGCDSCIEKVLSPASTLPTRVSPRGLSGASRLDWNGNARHKEIRTRFLVSGLSSRSGELFRGGHGKDERARVSVSTTRTRAYREEDWAKLFQPEAMKKEDLKEYLNEDPVWLWVFKSWHSGIMGVLLFLWSQPGQIRHIEWPSLKSTVKMALLTLVVVMLLMVFLYAVDSLFRHLLKSSMKPMA